MAHWGGGGRGGAGKHLPALNVIRVRTNQPMPCKMPFDF